MWYRIQFVEHMDSCCLESQEMFWGSFLSNDPGKKGSNLFCCGAIRFPHIEMFSFLRRECINLQKGCLRKKMYLNSTFKGCIFVLKHFDQSQELQTMAKKCSQFYMIRTYDFCVTQTQTRFCYKEVGQKKRNNIHAALRRFRKIRRLNQSEPQYRQQ